MAAPVLEEAAQRVGAEVDEQLSGEEGREGGVEAVECLPLLRLRPGLPNPTCDQTIASKLKGKLIDRIILENSLGFI